jgi:hypothetical protein
MRRQNRRSKQRKVLSIAISYGNRMSTGEDPEKEPAADADTRTQVTPINHSFTPTPTPTLTTTLH